LFFIIKEEYTMSIKDESIKLRALALTGTFETSTLPPECFAGLTGNFDGAGMSFGVLQFNFKSKTLQPILNKLLANNAKLMEMIFGLDLPKLKKILAMPLVDQIAWADSISIRPAKRSVIQPWRDNFKTLGRTPECQKLQMAAAQWYLDNALTYFKKFGFWSERAYALCFDICVQCGSIGPVVTQRTNEGIVKLPKDLTTEQLEIEKMKILANRRAEVVRPQFVEDVRSRKLCIANGAGSVHGLKINLERDFNIKLIKAAV
jgi:hypothetical protein